MSFLILALSLSSSLKIPGRCWHFSYFSKTSSAHIFLPVCHRGSFFLQFRQNTVVTSCNWSKSRNRPKIVFTLEMGWTMVLFDPDRGPLFSDRGSAVWFRLWSGGSFTPVILVQIKLKSTKVWAKRVSCERPLRSSLRQFLWKFYFKCRGVGCDRGCCKALSRKSCNFWQCK